MKRALVVLAIGCGNPEPVHAPAALPPAPSTRSTSLASADPAVDPRVPETLREMHVIPSGTANDDFPHRTRDMRARLADAQTCVPPGVRVPPGEMLPDDAILLALDSIGPDLVVCAQVLTRRDVSVFFDEVIYACWNLDPKTGFLTRRKDLGRSYVDCRDGSCTAGTAQAVSRDGKAIVSGDDPISITERGGTRVIASFPRPSEIHEVEWIRGQIELVGNVLFAGVYDHVYAFDLAGKLIATLDGGQLHVVSDKVVLGIRDPLHADAYNLDTHAITHVEVPGCKAAEIGEQADARSAACNRALDTAHLDATVDHMGTRYAIDNTTRKLVVLDSKTFRRRSDKQLAICK